MADNESAGDLASRVLALLASGDVDAASKALEATVEKSRVERVTTFSEGLRDAAFACTIGYSAPDETMMLPLVDTEREAGGGTLRVGQALLAAMKAEFTSNPDVLAPASALLRSFGSSGARWSTILAPLERSLALSVLPTGVSTALSIIPLLLSAHEAARSASERASLRLMFAAREEGMNQREIAKIIRKPQTHVHRQLRAIDDDPSVLALRPSEIYENFLAGHLDRQSMLGLLAAYPYEEGQFPVDAPDWAFVPGSWDELTQLAIEGAISKGELDVILAGAHALSVAS